MEYGIDSNSKFEENSAAEPLLMNDEDADSTMTHYYFLSSIGFNIPTNFISSIVNVIWNFLYLILRIFNPFYWLDNCRENDIERLCTANQRL